MARTVVGENALGRYRVGTLDPEHPFGIALGADQVANATMHQQIGVAADRRGEVGIGRVVQAEVAACSRGW